MKTYMCLCTHGYSHPLFVCLQVHIHALHTHAFASMFCRHAQFLLYSNIAQTGYRENTNYQVHQIYIFGTLATWRQHSIIPKKNTRDDIIITKDNTHKQTKCFAAYPCQNLRNERYLPQNAGKPWTLIPVFSTDWRKVKNIRKYTEIILVHFIIISYFQLFHVLVKYLKQGNSKLQHPV